MEVNGFCEARECRVLEIQACQQSIEGHVATPPGGDSLSERCHIVVVLRLVMNRSGVLSHGEVVDSSGRVRGRFSGWEALTPAVRNWLENASGK